MRRRRAWAPGAALATLLACAPLRAGPELVDPVGLDPSIRVEMRYAGPDNFVGSAIDGYEAFRCLLTPAAAEALAQVQRDLRPLGLSLLVYDCYRPQRAVDHFARWARLPSDDRTAAAYYPRVAKDRLFELGYIALRSGHSRGSTVDLTLASAGAPLDMGTPFDRFDPASRTDSTEVTEVQRANRQQLRNAMERRGFRNLPQEWWHFTLDDEPYPDDFWDVPVR